ARILRSWLAEGLHDDRPDLPVLTAIDVGPGSRILHDPARTQQLAVRAKFADGSSRDVTRLTVFTSSDNAVADVSSTGIVGFHQSGEVAVLCRYLDTMRSVRLTYLESKNGFHWSAKPEQNFIDKLVFDKLRVLSIEPSELCSDEEFVRRTSLDI